MARHQVSLAAPPTPIQVYPGDQISVVVAFDYVGPEAPQAKAHLAMFSWSLADPHNEKVDVETVFSIPQSPSPGSHIELAPLTFTVPGGLSKGLEYGLYVKIFNVPGKEWFHYIGKNDPPYYQWIIEVLEEEAEISNLRIVSYSKV